MNFEAIFNEAHKAGHQAAMAVEEKQYVVRDSFSGQTWPMSGLCGFAWVRFAGNTAWGRWAKKNKGARSAYPKGLQIWIGDYGQSHAKKTAYAQAFADMLNQHSIDAYAEDRLD